MNKAKAKAKVKAKVKAMSKYEDINQFKEPHTHNPLTREFLIKRGYCCSMKCLNCPYTPKHTYKATKLRS